MQNSRKRDEEIVYSPKQISGNRGYFKVDIDTQASKRETFIAAVQRYFESIGGELTAVATFGTESSKAALQTACRGLGYENEVGSYLSSLVPQDRGFVRSLYQCYHGDEEKGYKPIPQFIDAMNKHPDVWKVAQNIEGLISHRGERRTPPLAVMLMKKIRERKKKRCGHSLLTGKPLLVIPCQAKKLEGVTTNCRTDFITVRSAD